MLAYELKAKLKHLTLFGQDNDKELEWIGTDSDWKKVRAEMKQWIEVGQFQ